MSTSNSLKLTNTQRCPPSVETYDLFAQDLPSQNLGFVDPKTPTLELIIAGRDLTIHQSPGVLASNRAGDTTGAGASSWTWPVKQLPFSL